MPPAFLVHAYFNAMMELKETRSAPTITKKDNPNRKERLEKIRKRGQRTQKARAALQLAQKGLSEWKDWVRNGRQGEFTMSKEDLDGLMISDRSRKLTDEILGL